MISDSVIRIDDFPRDDKPNAFFIGSLAKLKEAILRGETYGIAAKIARCVFCENTEKMNRWSFDGYLNKFYVIDTKSKYGSSYTAICHMTEGFSTCVAKLDEELDTWVLEPKFAKQWIHSFSEIKEEIGIDEMHYKRLLLDIEEEILNAKEAK